MTESDDGTTPLRALRVAAGHTQEAAAVFLGVAQS